MIVVALLASYLAGSAPFGLLVARIASGKDLLGYNLIGSYALGRAKHDPSLGVVLRYAGVRLEAPEANPPE